MLVSYFAGKLLIGRVSPAWQQNIISSTYGGGQRGRIVCRKKYTCHEIKLTARQTNVLIDLERLAKGKVGA